MKGHISVFNRKIPSLKLLPGTFWDHSPGESILRKVTAQPAHSSHPPSSQSPRQDHEHLPGIPPSLFPAGCASPSCPVCLPPSLSPYLALPHQHTPFPLLMPSSSPAPGAPGLTFPSPGYLQEATSEGAVTGDFPALPAPARHGAAGGRFLTADIINSANPQIPPSAWGMRSHDRLKLAAARVLQELLLSWLLLPPQPQGKVEPHGLDPRTDGANREGPKPSMALLPRQGIAGITPALDAAMEGRNSELVLLTWGEDEEHHLQT